MLSRTATTLVGTVLALLSAGAAGAVPAVVNDSQGRAINFDVQAPEADVAAYAAILDGAIHGDEISNVTVRIVPQGQIRTECGEGAAACYRWSSRNGQTSQATMIVAAQEPARVAPALVHEYGHHIDNSYRHIETARGLDGTPEWWKTRGMAARLSAGEVRWDYGLGWDRAIAEIFAEDYARLNLPSANHKIRWLGPPSTEVLDAMRADLGPNAGPPATTPPPPAQQPTAPPPPGPAGSPGPEAPGAQPIGTPPGPLPKLARSRFGMKISLRPGKARTIRIPIASVRRVRVGVKVVSKRGRRTAVATLRCNSRKLDKRRGVRKLRRGGARVLQAPRATPGTCLLRVKAGKRPVSLRIAVKKIRTV